MKPADLSSKCPGYIRIEKNGPFYKEVRSLYESAFPEEERPPFDWHFQAKAGDEVYAYAPGGEFVGLTILVQENGLLYVFFLAIEEKRRRKGYGGKILADIVSAYPDSRPFLFIEELDEKYPDYRQRIERSRFYLRQGWKLTEIKTNEFEAIYQMMCFGDAEVSLKEFHSMMAKRVEKRFAKLYYPLAFE